MRLRNSAGRMSTTREPDPLFYQRSAISFAIDFEDFDERIPEWIFARYALAQELKVLWVSADAFDADVNNRRVEHALDPVEKPTADTLRVLMTDPHRVYHSLEWTGALLAAASGAVGKSIVDIGVAWVRQHRALRRDRRTYVEIYGPDGRILERVEVDESTTMAPASSPRPRLGLATGARVLRVKWLRKRRG